MSVAAVPGGIVRPDSRANLGREGRERETREPALPEGEERARQHDLELEARTVPSRPRTRGLELGELRGRPEDGDGGTSRMPRLPAASVELQCTLVVPIGNVAPEAGVHETTGFASTLSVAVAL